MAQLSTIIMQYIDASMVGSLGADAAASVGLMNSSLWMFRGVCSMITMGFSVQVAHRLGAREVSSAREVLRQGIVACAVAGYADGPFGACAGAMVAAMARRRRGNMPWGDHLLRRLRVGPSHTDSQLPRRRYAASCAGNMKVPGILSVAMCVLDVVFNSS